MQVLALIYSFIFGTIVGSFLNVVALRFNSGKTLGGRSMCMSCGRTLTWRELIPVFSFLFQSGSCRKCKSKISWQYPLVEFISGAIFVLIFLYFPPFSAVLGLRTFFYVSISCILMVITVYDNKHKIIPDRFSYAFAILALLSQFVGGPNWFHVPTVATLLAGPILALPFALIWLVSRGRWMGLGDAKLTLGIGWLLGLNGGLNALILAFWIAAAVSILWLVLTRKRYKPRMEIPFGPYLILGTYIALFWHPLIIDLHMLRDILMSI